MHPTHLAVLAGKARPDLRELVESGEAAGDFFGWRETLREMLIENFRRYRSGPLRNVVDGRLGYVGSAPLVGTSREGGIG